MATKDLEKFLRRLQKGEDRGFDADKVKGEWLGAIKKLLEQVTAWLEPLQKKHLVELRQSEVTIREESLGIYNAPVLEIEAGGRKVFLEPVARVVFGGSGRVDMGHGRLARVLIREPNELDRWLISTSDPKDDGKALTEESFTEALQSLLS